MIEDNSGDAELIRWQLLEHDPTAYQVRIVGSLQHARELLTAAEDFVPDVILLDLNLPDSQGIDTVLRCRSLTEAPIVVLTGLDAVSASHLAIESGAEDYITKGESGSTLRRAIRYAMLRHARDADARLAATVFTHAREAIVITDAEVRIIDANQTFERITGYRRADVLGQNPSIMNSGRHPPEFFAEMWQNLQDQGYWYGEIWNRHRDGHLYAVMLALSVVRDNRGCISHYVGLFSDITLQKQYAQQLEQMAFHDALTGLANRILLRDRVLHAMARCRRRGTPLALAFIDLDGFKTVNDHYGHDIGDELLIAVSQRMLEALREEDTLARLGGDEFVAVFTDWHSLPALQGLLDRLLEAIATPLLIRNHQLGVSASIGVAVYDPECPDGDADLLLRQADQAMYTAKTLGKSRYHFFTNHYSPP